MRTPFCLGSQLQLLVLAIAFASGTESIAWPQLAQEPPAKLAATKTQESERPLPDIAALMRDVEANQKAAEAIRKDYLYHVLETRRENDGNGAVKKTLVNEYDVFWVNGVPVQRLLKKNGKELTPEDQKKESERIDKDVAKAHERIDKADAKGEETGPRGNEMITASRILELGNFTNPRRITLDGRDTIVVDYNGNPKAKTRNRAEEVFRDLVGTVWVDEQDRVIRKTVGHFLNPFKIGAGLVVNVRKDTSFGLDQKKVNGEVWLPARLDCNGAARFLLVISFNGSLTLEMSDYRKFKATSTILPGVNAVEDGTPAAPQ